MNVKHAADAEPDAGAPVTAEPDHHGAHEKPTRTHRRVTTDPVPGTDPSPEPEPSRSSGTENDARLKQDVPPHWG